MSGRRFGDILPDLGDLDKQPRPAISWGHSPEEGLFVMGIGWTKTPKRSCPERGREDVLAARGKKSSWG